MGRLLIAFLQVHRSVLHRPFLYLSYFLKRHRAEYYDQPQARGLGGNGLRLLDLLFRRPLANVRLVREELGVSFATAGRLVGEFVDLGLLQEVTGGRRNRVFRYTPYLEHVVDREPGPGQDVPRQVTEAAPDGGR